MDRTKIKPDAFTKKLVAAAYPKYNGRKIRLDTSGRAYQMDNYFDGGSRTYLVAVELSSLRVVPASAATANPFNRIAHAEVGPRPGIALLEHSIFCGKDAGVTIRVHPDDAAKLLPAQAGA